MPINFNEWLKNATNEDRNKIASISETTVKHLWQIAGNHTRMSNELKGRLSRAFKLTFKLEVYLGLDAANPKINKLWDIPESCKTIYEDEIFR